MRKKVCTRRAFYSGQNLGREINFGGVRADSHYFYLQLIIPRRTEPVLAASFSRRESEFFYAFESKEQEDDDVTESHDYSPEHLRRECDIHPRENTLLGI